MTHPNEGLRRELASTVSAFAAKEMGSKRARRARDEKDGFERALWKRFGELGWLGVLVPEAYGGLGLGPGEMAVVARHLAAGILPEPVSACAAFAARALVDGDNEALKEALLPALCAGELVATVAWQERAGESDPSRIDTRAQRHGDRIVLDGTKRFVAHAGAADGYVVSARSEEGIGLYWVRRSSDGVRLEEKPLADRTRHAALRLERVAIADRDVVAAPPNGAGALREALNAALLSASAELLGVVGASLDVTLAYLRTRSQFGKLIGSFQALQHRAVDMYVAKEFTACALDAAISALETEVDADARDAAASRAKARSSDTALHVARESIQMHGAIGWTDECDVGLYVKRSLILSAWLGDGAAHRRRYARLRVR